MSRSTRSIGLTLATVAGIASLAIAPAAAPAAGNHRQRGKHKGTHQTTKPATRHTKDRNRNGIPDTWEKKFGLSVRTDQAKKDADKDGLSNKAEFLAGTDPTNPDTDADGTPDGQEHAGKVVSFDGTTLVVSAFGGSQLTGTVDANTEVQCEQGASVTTPPTAAVRSHGDDDQGDSEDQGDDNGTDAADTEDQGDDNAAPAAGATPAKSGSSHSGSSSSGDQGDDDSQDQGDDNGSDGENDTGGDATCPAGVLAPDAIVHEGHLSVTASGAHWDEITIVI